MIFPLRDYSGPHGAVTYMCVEALRASTINTVHSLYKPWPSTLVAVFWWAYAQGGLYTWRGGSFGIYGISHKVVVDKGYI